jgi:hypothetical protein
MEQARIDSLEVNLKSAFRKLKSQFYWESYSLRFASPPRRSSREKSIESVS